MKLSCMFGFLLISLFVQAQDDHGFIITEQDSLIRGRLVVKREGPHGSVRYIELMKPGRKKPKTYYAENIRYYALRRDTFALLNAFYPFEGEDYYAQGLEAKVIVARGKMKLYEAVLRDYATGTILMPPPEYAASRSPSHVMVAKEYPIYIVRDRANILYGIKRDRHEFVECVRRAMGDDVELMTRIENRELKARDMEEIVRLYNSR